MDDQLSQRETRITYDLSRFKKVRNTGARQQLISSIAAELGIENVRAVFFKARMLTDRELEQIKNEAVKFKKNPAALFWKLLKLKDKEIRDRIKEV